ncbi:hypothetical protein [Clostridium sp.]
MIYNEPFKMLWEVKYCEIKNDEIVEVKGISSEKYNPFDYYGKDAKCILYRKFMSLDKNSNDAILEFIRHFGFLGLDNIHRKNLLKESNEKLKSTELYMTTRENILIKLFAEKIDSITKTPRLPVLNNKETYWSKIAKNPELLLHTEVSNVEYKANDMDNSSENFSNKYVNILLKNKDLPMKENINEIKIEIERMKLILDIWDSVSFKNIEIINKSIFALRLFDKDESTKQYIIKNFKSTDTCETYEQALYFAKIVMTNEINQQIVRVTPYLAHDNFQEFMNAPTIKSKGHWSAPDLLSAMYVMIYMDFVEGKMVRKCRNETCTKPPFEIYGNDTRKIYCSPKCANTQCKRESRRRRKAGVHTDS